MMPQPQDPWKKVNQKIVFYVILSHPLRAKVRDYICGLKLSEGGSVCGTEPAKRN